MRARYIGLDAQLILSFQDLRGVSSLHKIQTFFKNLPFCFMGEKPHLQLTSRTLWGCGVVIVGFQIYLVK